MKIVIEVDIDELDEKALKYMHRDDMRQFAFNSHARSLVESARYAFVSAARESASSNGAVVPSVDNDVLRYCDLPSADARHEQQVAAARAESERLMREAEAKAAADAEEAALKQKAEDERIAALVSAQVAAIIGAQNPPPPEGEPAT